MKIYLYILLMIFTLTAIACRPATNQIKNDMDNAVNVHIGYVTGITNLSFEESLKENRDPEMLIIPETHKMRIFIKQTLKGQTKSTLDSFGPFCGIYYAIREKIYVFEIKGQVNAFAINEQDFKSINGELFEKLSK